MRKRWPREVLANADVVTTAGVDEAYEGRIVVTERSETAQPGDDIRLPFQLPFAASFHLMSTDSTECCGTCRSSHTHQTAANKLSITKAFRRLVLGRFSARPRIRTTGASSDLLEPAFTQAFLTEFPSLTLGHEMGHVRGQWQRCFIVRRTCGYEPECPRERRTGL